jgi:starch synthase (maltosyl-transferring)
MNDSARAQVRNTLAPFAVIEDVQPQVDGGRFAAKRTVGDVVTVTAAGFAHGHEKVACAVRYRRPGDSDWAEAAMEFLGNDRWRATFTVDRVGGWQFGVACWIDHLASWREGFERRVDVEDMRIAARVGAELVAESAANAAAAVREQLGEWAKALREESEPQALRALAMDDTLLELARIHAPRAGATQSVSYPVFVDRERARFSSWYELFPRSLGEAGSHGTFADVEKRLDYIQSLGFDVVYLPPIHPIGTTKRKGRNNSPPRSRATSAAPGASAAPRAGTPPCIPISARSRISATWSRRRRRAAWRSRSTSPSRRPRTIRG